VVRQRISWRLHATTLLNESAFKKYYRMSLTTFEELLCIVGPYLVVDYYQSLRRSYIVSPLTPAGMLQCALSWLAGGSYHHVRVITGVSTATFYRVVYRVMFAINDSGRLAPQFPINLEEMKQVAKEFQSRSNHGVIEDCIGVIDGWLCPIRVPVDSPGGMNDSYAFQRWRLIKVLQNIDGKYFVIGDNAYVQSKRVMTPFNKAQLVDHADRDSYNFHISQLRIRIEMAFGLLVNKWRIVKQHLHVRLRHCRIIISACMRLHIFLYHSTLCRISITSRSSFSLNYSGSTRMESSGYIGLR
ncbi:hypothetical protein PHMEG_00027649, partial [Phytophthora megakarya]